ncbi:MAG: hypothetical protein ACR2NR_09815 [Solirubrobacteraceae bacterium]
MSESDQPPVTPSEQRGGKTPGPDEAREKGEWAAHAQDGIVPAELGGSDAPREILDDDPELGSSVLGETTGSEESATTDGVDRSGGERSDAVTDGGGGGTAPAGVEPDLKDAAAGPRQADLQSAAEADK